MNQTIRRWLGYALASSLLAGLASTTSWGQCACTTTASGNATVQVTTPNTVVCIAPGTTFSGNIAIRANNVTVCNQGTFTGNLNLQNSPMGTTFNNQGTVTGSRQDITAPLTIVNASGATWNEYLGVFANLDVTNAGTWASQVQEQGSGRPVIRITHNGGSWTGDLGGGAGTLQLTNNATWTKGFNFPAGPNNRFTTAAGATSALAGYLGPFPLQAQIVNNGTLQLTQGMGLLLAGSQLTNAAGSTLQLNGSLLGGTVSNLGTIRLTGNLQVSTGDLLSSQGLLDVGQQADVYGTLQSSAELRTGGNLNVQPGGSVVSSAPLTVGAQLYLASLSSLTSSSSIAVQLNFTSFGAVVSSGSVRVGQQFDNNVSFSNSGTFASTGTNFNFNNLGRFVNTGTINWQGNFYNLPAARFENTGVVQNLRDFTNQALGVIVGGSNGRRGIFRASNYTVNLGLFGFDNSLLDFCDATPSSLALLRGFDVQAGLVGNNVTNCAAPLPVTLTSFEARPQGSEVQLAWTTASELNSLRFDVERSADGKAFAPVATVAAAGSSATTRHYGARDPHPLPGLSYYRLHQVDADGSSAYSATVPLRLDAVAALPRCYPNPTRGQLSLDLRMLPAAPCTVRLLDVLGRQARTATLPGGQEAALDLSELPAGTYLLQLEAPGQAPVRERVQVLH